MTYVVKSYQTKFTFDQSMSTFTCERWSICVLSVNHGRRVFLITKTRWTIQLTEILVCRLCQLPSLAYDLQISALYGAMYLLEIHVASVSAVLLPVLTDFLSKKLTALTG